MYNIAITLVISMLNKMDATGAQVTARSYALQISNFSFCVSAALAHANVVLVGWYISGCEIEACNRDTRRAAVLGIGASIVVSGFFVCFSKPLVGLFTDDPDMIRLVGIFLIVDIFLEIGRSANLVYGFALKTSGDAVYPMTIRFLSLISIVGYRLTSCESVFAPNLHQTGRCRQKENPETFAVSGFLKFE